MKNKKYIFLTVIITVIILVFIGLLGYMNVKKRKAEKAKGLEEINYTLKPPQIMFIPGFLSKNVSSGEYYAELKKVFSESKIKIEKWESGESKEEWYNVIANDIIANDEFFAEELFERIKRMEAGERENLVLIGHSLGGRIAIRTLAKLAKENIRIRRGIFLGAAIPDDDKDISMAINATMLPCINVCSKEDYVLRNIYGMGGEKQTESYMKCALGAYGSRTRHPDLALLEFKVDFAAFEKKQDAEKTSNHDYKTYIYELGKQLKDSVKQLKDSVSNDTEKYNNHDSTRYIYELGKRLNEPSLHSAIFPPMSPRRWSIEKDTWEKVNQVDGWTLYKHNLTMQYKIVSPNGNTPVIADEDIAMLEYEKLQENLRNVNRINSLKIHVENEDKPLQKIIPTLGWKTEEEFNGWLLQGQKLLRRYRILDAHDFQRAHGNKEDMKRVFENIKAQLRQ